MHPKPVLHVADVTALVVHCLTAWRPVLARESSKQAAWMQHTVTHKGGNLALLIDSTGSLTWRGTSAALLLPAAL